MRPLTSSCVGSFDGREVGQALAAQSIKHARQLRLFLSPLSTYQSHVCVCLRPRLLTLCPAAYSPCAPGPALAHSISVCMYVYLIHIYIYAFLPPLNSHPVSLLIHTHTHTHTHTRAWHRAHMLQAHSGMPRSPPHSRRSRPRNMAHGLCLPSRSYPASSMSFAY